MGTTRTAGFTILETMLFLAITGVLIVSLLTGIGTSVTTQRYKDSVASFESLLQEQYSDLVNASNDQNASSGDNAAPVNAPWVCNTDGTVTDTDNSTAGVPRGQSDCVLLGRYMQVDAQGNITIEAITGYHDPLKALVTGGDDIASLEANYTLGLSNINTVNTQLQWGATLSWLLPQSASPPVAGSSPDTTEPAGTPRSIALLFIQSPDSGTIYTFTVDSPPDISSVAPADLLQYIDAGTGISKVYNGSTIRGQDARIMCIQSGSTNLGAHMAVYLNAYASDGTAVESQSNDLLSTEPGDPQC